MSDYDIPSNCLYTREDEWVRGEGDLLVVGITDYAQNQLGDVVFLELPGSDEEVHAGEPFGVIESVKAVSDLFAPVTGEVEESNDALQGNPELVNESCYEDGWLLKLRPADLGELDSLMDAEAYQAYIEEREE